MPAGSTPPASAMPSSTWASSAWSIWSPEKSVNRDVSIGSNVDAASASVMLVPPPPKSTSTTTPRPGSPGLAFNARQRGDGIGDQARGHAVGRESRLGPHGGTQRAQGGSGPVRGHRHRESGTRAFHLRPRPCRRALRPRARRRGTTIRRRSPGALGRRRARRNHSSTCPDTVSTDRRVRGGLPTRAATMLVVPIDNPNGSLITDLTIAGNHGRNRLRHSAGSATNSVLPAKFWLCRAFRNPAAPNDTDGDQRHSQGIRQGIRDPPDDARHQDERRQPVDQTNQRCRRVGGLADRPERTSPTRSRDRTR